MTGPEITAAVTGDTRLGECPLWSDTEQALYWVDIDGRRVNRHDPATDTDEHRPLPGRPGSIALTATDGTLLVATENELVWLDWSTGSITPWIELEPAGTGNRANDGRTDPAGRMIVGTMWPDTSAAKSTGSLYQVAADGTAVTLATGLGVPNGAAFDPERSRMYFTDSPTRTVMVADYDAATGERRDIRPFFEYGTLPGKPDGGCVDAEGGYWSASVHGWAVIRVTPDGVLDRRVELPVAHPTMPAFGGPGLATMYVTSIAGSEPDPGAAASDGFTAGDVLAIDIDATGRPEPRFAGTPPRSSDSASAT